MTSFKAVAAAIAVACAFTPAHGCPAAGVMRWANRVPPAPLNLPSYPENLPVATHVCCATFTAREYVPQPLSRRPPIRSRDTESTGRRLG